MVDCSDINERKKEWLDLIRGLNDFEVEELRRMMWEKEGKESECIRKSGELVGTAIAILEDACEGRWDDAYDNVNRRLEKEIKSLENCLCLPNNGEIFLRNKIKEIKEAIRKKDIKLLANKIQTIAVIAPYDTYEFLRGRCPFKREICSKIGW